MYLYIYNIALFTRLREGCRKAKDKFFADLDMDNQRVEFLPCEWRSTLHLDGGKKGLTSCLIISYLTSQDPVILGFY